MKEYIVKFKNNSGKSLGYGYHIGMYRLFGAENETYEINIPRFQIFGNGIVRFYTDETLKNESVLAFQPTSTDVNTVASGFNIVFAPTRKDKRLSGTAKPVQPTEVGKNYIKGKLAAMLAQMGITDADIELEYGHAFSEQFKKGLAVHNIMTAAATVRFASPHDISKILTNGYGKFKFNGLGYVAEIFHDSVQNQ